MTHEDKLRGYLKRVTVDLTDARRRLAELEAGKHEPIALVGLACRYPEAPNAEAYWDLLQGARSGVVDDTPDGRYDLDPYVAGQGVYTKRGGFLPEVASWDNNFFGVPPREAIRMDPQQRLLMELTWEALEDAGTPPPSLTGSRTAVIAGYSDTMQYGRLQLEHEGAAFVRDPYAGQGTSPSVVAGRLAYHFDLRGPTLTLDTACSSSLVAVHLAADSLRRRESDLAVAAGVFLLMHPDTYVSGCAMSMLSRIGMCQTFDTKADGYAIGEGGGVVVLERLSDALANGHRIHAVLRGSAVNQDGRSNGMTAPNRGAQIEVIRAALTAAGAAPDEVAYVEAHGSATALGDAIELGALNDVFGGRSAQHALHVGAVKSNIGHTQAAAGMAGLIKTVLILEQGVVPPNLNMTEPSEAVRASATVHPVTAEVNWPEPDGVAPHLAGVSSFGWTGTNAHVVLEAAPVPTEPTPVEPGRAPAALVAVSGAVEAALRDRLAQLADPAVWIRPFADVVHTLQSGRAALTYRRAVVATDADDVTAQLTAATHGPTVRRLSGTPRLGFLIGGTSLPPSAVDTLAQAEPVFAAAIERCRRTAASYGVDLRPDGSVDEPAPAAAGTFTAHYALATLLAHRGVRPDLVVGYGAGEYVAACLAGVLTVTDALALVIQQARVLDGSAPDTAAAELTALVAGTPRSAPQIGLATADAAGVRDAAAVADPSSWLGPSGPPSAEACLALGARRGVSLWLDLDVSAATGSALGARLRQLPEAPPVLDAFPSPGGPTPDDAPSTLLETCGRLWELGVSLDWAALRPADAPRPRMVDLPAYPFQRRRFWFDSLTPAVAPAPAVTGPTANSPDAGAVVVTTADTASAVTVDLLEQRWEAVTGSEGTAPSGRYVLVADTGGVADALAAHLREHGVDVDCVAASTDPGTALLTPADGGTVTVVHLATLDHEPGASAATGPALLSVSRTLAACGTAPAGTRVIVVTRGGQAATATQPVCPTQAAVGVLAMVANQEYLNLDCRTLDLDPAYDATRAAEAVGAELARTSDAVFVSHRDGVRQRPTFVPADPGSDAGVSTPAVRPDGAYLITGGLGEIGLIVAEHLVRSGAGRVVLTSRRGLPEDPQDRRTLAVARLRALGAQVDTPRVDVTDADAMRSLLVDGAIRGVVHTAADAAPETFRPLRDLDETAVARHFGAKVEGARTLSAVLADLPAALAPDWCLLFSSTSALLGGVTFGSYSAANAALTAVARSAATTGPATRWIAAEWDTWACTLDKLDGGIGATMAGHAMTDAQALAAFDRLVGQARPAVVVAAGGLTDRLPRPGTRDVVVVVPLGERYPRPELTQPYAAPRTPTERVLTDVWGDVLGIDGVGTRDNFFDLGGTSLLVPHMIGLIQQRIGVAVPTVALFEAPTVRSLAAVIDTGPPPAQTPAMPATSCATTPGTTTPGTTTPGTGRADPVPTSTALTVAPVPALLPEHDRRIAIVGMAGRFPGANDVETFWRNVRDGVDSIRVFTPEELIAAGVDPVLVHDPAYVPARPVLDDVAGFDAGFFGISPRMAALSDPQQRLFLEVCWEALEQSGYSRAEHRGRVGVFGGANISTYLLNIAAQLRQDGDVDESEIIISNDKDALTTTVSYLLDLHGPSVAVQTFCSTSLVAVHLAVQSLRSGDCEMAMAGGVSIRVPDAQGHLYTPGGQSSRDGHVHTFDAEATGTMFGDGATVVVLKRLADAVRDGDHVYGVIRGSAINNDGALKVGYTAPSVTGQARVVADAMRDAGVGAEDIGYIEAHGTATELGDPIEVAALTRAFGPTARRQSVPIGAVKTNVGHLNHAAGTAGLIKTALSLRDRVIPPTLHFTSPNPQIDFVNSPFFVNVETTDWTTDGRPRIAGLNSLGLGGTNVHVVVEEPPGRSVAAPGDATRVRRAHVLPVSARTATAAEQATRRLAAHLEAHPDARLADVAYSLQVGRKTFEHRRVAVVTGLADAVTAMDEDGGASARVETVEERPVALLIAGVGEQYPGMVGELYRREPQFRAVLDECLAVLTPALPGVDLADLLLGARSGGPDLAALMGRGPSRPDARVLALARTEVVQPLMFAVDYALARTLMAWGVQPAMMLGYSLGEYVAACLAGVLSLPDALALVVHRAALIDGVEKGDMAAVPMSAEQLRGRFRLEQRGLDVAALNGPETTVVAGPHEAMSRLGADLERAGVPMRALDTTHAFHSRMLAPLAEELTAWVRANVTLNPPSLPYLSNVTGGPADAALVCDPGYWAAHMCQTVQFAAATAALLTDDELAIVEIGPGQSLGALTRAAGCPPERWALITSTLPAAGDPRPADTVLTECLARLWLVGVELDWAGYHGRSLDSARVGPTQAVTDPYDGALPGRIPLPTYPFQRHRYWIDAAPAPGSPGAAVALPDSPRTMSDIGTIPRLAEQDWLALPTWRQTAAPAPDGEAPASWLVLADGERSSAVLATLRSGGPTPTAASAVTVVRPGDRWARTGDGYTVRPGNVEDALALLRALAADGTPLQRLVHLWTLDVAVDDDAAAISLGLDTLVALARAAGEVVTEPWRLDIVTTGSQEVLGGEARPETSTLVGPALVIPLEYPSVTTRLIDVEPGTAPADLVAELRRPRTDPTVALRGRRRWVPTYETVPTAETPDAGEFLREGGVYLLTGGLGGIALGLAEQLAGQCRAKLVLLARTGLPPRELWDAITSGGRDAEEGVRSRVARVQALLELGAEVEIVVGDVGDAQDVARAVARAEEHFGALHGVLHTAGVPGTGLMHFKQPSDSEVVLTPKVAGTRALDLALRIGRPDEIALDFLVLFSSITSATGGGPGQVDYSAANAFLDGYAAQHSARGRRVLSVNWGEWAWNAWDSELTGFDTELQAFFRSHRARFGITFAEGWRSLVRALASGESRVFVSSQDLATMVRFSSHFTIDAVTAPPAASSTSPRHPRPELVTAYLAATGDTEEGIAAIWCETLRLERVGVVDNFFELGGSSLLGIGLLTALRRAFPAAELPPHILYEAPTVQALARAVDHPSGGSPLDATGAPGSPQRHEDGRMQAQLRRSGVKAAAARRRR